MKTITLNDNIDNVKSNTSSCFKVMYNGIKVWESRGWNKVDIEDHDCLTFTSDGTSYLSFYFNDGERGIHYSGDKIAWSVLLSGHFVTVDPDHPFYLRGKITAKIYRDNPIIKITGDKVRIDGNITALYDYTKDPLEVDVCEEAFCYLFHTGYIEKMPTMVMRSAARKAFEGFMFRAHYSGKAVINVGTAEAYAFSDAFAESDVTSADLRFETARTNSFYRVLQWCPSLNNAVVYGLDASGDSFVETFKSSAISSLKILCDGSVRNNAFRDILYNCPNLSALRCNCNNISTFEDLLGDVAETGILTINSGVTPPTMPAGWTIQYM